jgi:hypothetical protein
MTVTNILSEQQACLFLAENELPGGNERATRFSPMTPIRKAAQPGKAALSWLRSPRPVKEVERKRHHYQRSAPKGISLCCWR